MTPHGSLLGSRRIKCTKLVQQNTCHKHNGPVRMQASLRLSRYSGHDIMAPHWLLLG